MATIEELNKEAEALDAERLAMRERGKELAERRSAAAKQRELDIWGLTEAEYDACKAVVEAPRIAAAAHAALINKRRKLLAKADNPKFSEAARAEFRKEVTALEPEIVKAGEEMQRAIDRPAPPLWQVLNEKRIAKGLQSKNIQGRKAG